MRVPLLLGCGFLLLVGCAKLHDPQKIASEMLPALIDVEATKRATQCERLGKDLVEFNAGKPFETQRVFGEICKVVSKGKPDKPSYGGYEPETAKACDALTADLPRTLSRHENNLQVKMRIYCGADGKPTLQPDASVRLAAQIAVRENLAKTVKAANSGSVSPHISKCYFGVKKQMTATLDHIRTERCTVMRGDRSLPNMTYEAGWMHAALFDEYKRYQEEHAENYQKLVKADKVTTFFDAFNEEALSLACATDVTLTVAGHRAAALVAQETCM